MLKRSALLFVTFISSCLLLAACNRYVSETNKKIETTLERVEDYLEQAQVPDLPESNDTVHVHNDIWLGNQSVKIMEGDALPTFLEKEDGVTLAIAKDATLPEIAQQISDLTNIPVHLDDLKIANAIPEDAVSVRYTGKLSGLLNYLSGRYGVYWNYRDKAINFFASETRVFTIYALPTETTFQTSLQGSTMGEGSGGGNASSSLSSNTNLALWDNIEEGVKQVAGESAQLSFSRVAGTVSVTASPYIINKVAKYIDNWNEKLSRQVAITVRVFEVTLSNSDGYGLDLSAVFNGKYLLLQGGAMSGLEGAGQLTMGILDSKKFEGSNAVVHALSTQGKTRYVTSASVTTMNNKVAPVQVTQSMNYVRETSVTTSGSGDSQTKDYDVDVDTLTYGMTMDILPRILDHGRLMILLAINLTSFGGLEPFETGDGGQVQLPNTGMRAFVQEVAMRSGSTLVLTGFEEVKDEISTAGVGKPKMGLLGGKAKNDNDRKVLVILVTPEVLQSPLSQEALMRDY